VRKFHRFIFYPRLILRNLIFKMDINAWKNRNKIT